MKRYSMLAVGLVAGAMFAGAVAAQTIQINRENKTIAINATDEATAQADIAAVTIGFEVFGPDSDSTYALGGETSQAVLAALKKAGVEDKSIESVNQGIDRFQDYDQKDTPEQRAKKQFVFRQSWTVSVAPQSAAVVIRDAVAAGANKSGEIDWRLSDHRTLQAKAAEAALVKARAIAGQMAEGLHVKLGDLIYASNQAQESKPVLLSMLRIAPGAVAAPPPPPLLEIRAQTIHETATVYAVFAIE